MVTTATFSDVFFHRKLNMAAVKIGSSYNSGMVTDRVEIPKATPMFTGMTFSIINMATFTDLSFTRKCNMAAIKTGSSYNSGMVID